jgi:hypothetical protein
MSPGKRDYQIKVLHCGIIRDLSSMNAFQMLMPFLNAIANPP